MNLIYVLLVLVIDQFKLSTTMATRNEILCVESALSVGGSVKLTDNEKKVNEHLLKLKKEELVQGHSNSSTFTPNMHFFDAKTRIERSNLYQFIKKIPKGGCLHTHLSAAVSLDYLLTYLSDAHNLYANFVDGKYKLRFLNDTKLAGDWRLLTDLNKEPGYADFLKGQLSLETKEHELEYPDIETTWQKFMKKFSATYDMYTYKPFLYHIIQVILNEFLQDNITYVEFRIAPLQIYDLNETIYSPSEFCTIIQDAISDFKNKNAHFIGAKLIISPSRRLEDDAMQNAITVYKNLKTQFPNLIAGFDLVGYEELGRPLDSLKDILKGLNGSELFLHGGETNWFGNDCDYNLLDAILMGSKRIGHAYSLSKHPEAMQLVKNKGIAIEVMPISNQVLKLVKDLRNHPAAVFISQGVPIVICNDDPTLFGSSGVSYDWFLVFLAMTREDAGLEFIKEVAMNSIKYSAMQDDEKKMALGKWKMQWDEFIANNELLVSTYGHPQVPMSN